MSIYCGICLYMPTDFHAGMAKTVCQKLPLPSPERETGVAQQGNQQYRVPEFTSISGL